MSTSLDPGPTIHSISKCGNRTCDAYNYRLVIIPILSCLSVGSLSSKW